MIPFRHKHFSTFEDFRWIVDTCMLQGLRGEHFCEQVISDDRWTQHLGKFTFSVLRGLNCLKL